MTTKDLAFIHKFETAKEIAAKASSMVVSTVAEFATAEQTLKTIRDLEKELESEYAEHPVIVEAKRIRSIKGDLATILENARKGLKGGAMLRFERAEEAKRVAEERRLAEIARKAAEAETARLVAEQKAAFDKAEKERKAAQKKGDDEAIRLATERAERARQEAAQIKADAAATPVPVVVVEKTAPTTSRRTIPKWRLADSTRVPCLYHKLDEVKISGVIRSLRANHGIDGIDYYEDLA